MRTTAFVGTTAILVALLFTTVPQYQAGEKRVVPQKYARVVDTLKPWIKEEIAEKEIPSLSIAIVEDQTVVWMDAFGFADPKTKTPATVQTLYRVGSVSKPITALLLMMMVELGMIDLDVPVQRYLPEFRPQNPYEKQITLRQMLSHRSGLVRESPVGNYFDATEPTLAATVKSLNRTTLVYPPTKKTSYSNAAVTTVGYVMQRQAKEPFAKLIQRKLLNRLGMTNSSYAPSTEQRKHIAHAIMWTLHGKTFPAPKWDLGMPPAGNLYSNAEDMAKLLKFLFAEGRGPKGRLLKRKTLESMYEIQFAEKGQKSGFGLSFFVSEFQGRKMIGHGGAVYGFATQLAALPNEKIGVIVMASRDVSNAVTRRIANVTLEQMLAAKEGKAPPQIIRTTKVPADVARKWAGRYRSKKRGFDVIQLNGRLWKLPLEGGSRVELRKLGNDFMTDGLLGHGERIKVRGDQLQIGKNIFRRAPVEEFKPVPEKWEGLIGEYGQDHNVLYILERDGKLHALIEWVFLYPLKEIAKDVYQFPDFGLYHGDKIVFERDESGRAKMAIAASVPFARRKLRGEFGPFRIRSLQPIAKLRNAALKAQPPEEKNAFFRKPNLVDVALLDKSIKFDIRYAGKNNFLGAPFYKQAKAYLQKPAAEAVLRVHQKLAQRGYGLLIYDAYRPWHVTKMFWDATPERYKLFVANPLDGSRHNRGCAVDLTLYDLKTGKPVEMVSGYDEFSDRSFPLYMGGTSKQRWHRDLLRHAMEAEGFTVYEAEWWHFDYRDWRRYGIQNATFEELGE